METPHDIVETLRRDFGAKEAPSLSEQLAQRRPVWEALSELFLDTDLQTADFDRLADTLAKSPYSPADLEAILLRELVPILWGNTASPAGEWQGFDPVWLEEQIQRRAERSLRWPSWLYPRRIVRADWARLRARVEQARAERDASV